MDVTTPAMVMEAESPRAEWPEIEWQMSWKLNDVCRGQGTERGERNKPGEGRPQPSPRGNIKQRDGEIGKTDKAEDLRIGEIDPGSSSVRCSPKNCEHTDKNQKAHDAQPKIDARMLGVTAWERARIGWPLPVL